MNIEIGLFLGGLIEEVKEIDSRENGECLGKFIRVIVLINVLKPLKRWVCVALGDKLDECNVLLCYVRLPNFCYFCGCMRHLIRDCMVNDRGLVDDFTQRFGSWLRAPFSRRAKEYGAQ
ncbi:hypothetical protein ACOSP7_016976 [Xanthoceras sorbifolium]